MKALVVQRPGRYGIKKLEIPKCNSEDVLIKIRATGICKSDLEVLDGTRPEPYVRYPIVLGHECSGVVEKCGPNVKTFMPGDKVVVRPLFYCGKCRNCLRDQTNVCEEIQGSSHKEVGFTLNGGFSEYIIVPESMVYKITGSVSFEVAALAEPTACVWNGIVRSKPKPGDIVAIIGSGPIGLLAVIFYQFYQPSKTILLGRREERNDLGRKMGATHTINVRKDNPVEAVRDIMGEKEPDIVFEAAGNIAAVKLAFQLVRHGGMIVLEGVVGGGLKVELESDLFVFKDIRLEGIFAYTARTFYEAVNLLERKSDSLKMLITHTFRLHDFERAFNTVRERKEGANKVLIKP